MYLSNQQCLKEIINQTSVHENHNMQTCSLDIYEGWNFNSGNYLFTTDTK